MWPRAWFARCAAIGFSLCLLLSAGRAVGAWHEREEAIMGTRIAVQVWHPQAATARAAMAAVIAEMHRIDALMSTYRESSDLSRVNREAATGPVVVSAELLALLARAEEFSVLTGGAFDITYASAGYLYDYHTGQRPNEAVLAAALPGIDYRHVELDPAHGTVRFARPGVRVDLGGIAKGYAVERAAAILRTHGIEHGQVSAGGDLRLVGDRRGRPWLVGVRDPMARDRIVAQLPLADEAISTSGDYERYFEQDGVRYHHILDPGRGVSASGVRSVSVIGPEGTATDALSTGVFVLGREAGMALIERLSGIEAIIVDVDHRLWFSSGLKLVPLP